jgi:hypothetical protein
MRRFVREESRQHGAELIAKKQVPAEFITKCNQCRTGIEKQLSMPKKHETSRAEFRLFSLQVAVSERLSAINGTGRLDERSEG